VPALAQAASGSHCCSSAPGGGAGVGGQVGEELVDAKPVVQSAGGGPPPPLGAGMIAARWSFVGGGRGDRGAELVDDVVVRVRAAVSALWPEPGHQLEAVQRAKPPLAEVQRAEQRMGDLEGGEHTVVVQPAQQDPVAVGELGLDSQNGIIHEDHAPRGRDPRLCRVCRRTSRRS
jgi:hypothetical protein